jgi:thioredoxin reductase
MPYDCVIVGGGFAGLQAAVQLGRYRHSVAVIDAADGRSVLCRRYHNLLGWPDGVSGEQLRALGRSQAERLGVRFVSDTAVSAERVSDVFRLCL